MSLPQCRLIVPYFDNPEMLKLQVENWSRFEGELRSAVRIIVVDDHSKQDPVPILEKCKATVHCYRINVKWPFNMHEARNIGAKQACKKAENMWLFMTDMDIMVTPEVMYSLLSRELDPAKHYTFNRVFAPEFMHYKRHPNTFLVKHAAFWQVNGYDLDLAPIGGGGYGGDTQFTRQLRVLVPEVYLDDVCLIGYGRRERDGQAAIKDADTTQYDRNEWHERYVDALNRKKKLGDMRSVQPIRSGYTRTL